MPDYAKEAEPARGGRPRKIALDNLRLEDACQARAKLHQETIGEYAELYKAEIKLPPIDVFEVDDQFVVVDGFHRVAAAAKAGVGFLGCKVVGKGSIDDAAWYAVSVNQAHGLRRSNADKRKAVRMVLEGIGSDQSTHTIADHVGVSHNFVNKVRTEWEDEQKQSKADSADEVSSDDNSTVVGKDGKRYPKKRKARAKAKAKAKTKPAADQLSSDDNSKVDEVDEADDRHAQIARMIKGLRSRISQRYGKNQTIDRHLEAAWRAADDLIAINCILCDGGGCPACKKGRTTKGDARRAKEKARSSSVAKGGKS